MNDLIIRKQHIDWLSIIDLAFKRESWGKDYTIFTLGDITINCRMREFNFEEERATFVITINYTKDNECNTFIGYIYYYLKNSTLTKFKRDVNLKIKSMINNLKDDILTKQAHTKYKHMFTRSWCISKEQIKESSFSADYDDVMDISNKSLRESCYDTLQESVAEEVNKDYNCNIRHYVRTQDVGLPNLDAILEEVISLLREEE